MLMQNFGATNKEDYGMLWYFLESSIAVFHVTSRRPCWWSKQKHFSPLGTKLNFHVNSSSKKSTVLTPNMTALSRGCNLWSPVLTIPPSIQRMFCVLFCVLLELPSRALRQERPYDPTSRWQRELQKKKRFRRQNNNFARVSHFFIHFFAASAGLRLGFYLGYSEG